MHAHALSHLLPALRPGARALDVGSGSGYLTAALGALVGPGGAAVGVEHVGALARGAERSLRRSEAGRAMAEEGRVRFVVGDGRRGLRDEGGEEGWDAIHVGAAAERVHEELVGQLREGGRMFIPVGGRYEEQSVWLVRKEGGEVKREKLFGVVYVPLTDPPPNSE
jgi:protein-L-isoaspartate(D-aspartate) O-methyltransferase